MQLNAGFCLHCSLVEDFALCNQVFLRSQAGTEWTFLNIDVAVYTVCLDSVKRLCSIVCD